MITTASADPKWPPDQFLRPPGCVKRVRHAELSREPFSAPRRVWDRPASHDPGAPLAGRFGALPDPAKRDTILPITGANPGAGKMERTMATTKTKRTPEEIVRALLTKTIENGATAGEERAVIAKAEELIAKHRLDRATFEFPPSREQLTGSRRSIRAACEELLSAEPALSYDDILAQVRSEFARCKTSVKCLRFYASKMRLRDVRVPVRPRASRNDPEPTP